MLAVQTSSNRPEIIPLPTRQDTRVFVDVDHPMAAVLRRRMLSPGLPGDGRKLSLADVRLLEKILEGLFAHSRAHPDDTRVQAHLRYRTWHEYRSRSLRIDPNVSLIIDQLVKERLAHVLEVPLASFRPESYVIWLELYEAGQYLTYLLLRPEDVYIRGRGRIIPENYLFGLE